MLDSANCSCDFARDKRLAAARRFVIEENPIYSEQVIGLTVITRNVKCIGLGRSIWAARVKWGSLALWDFDRFAIELGRRCLIKAGIEFQFPHCLQQAYGADACDLSRVLWYVKRNPNMGLRAQIINFVGAHEL
jgi:hypothetical protein